MSKQFFISIFLLVLHFPGLTQSSDSKYNELVPLAESLLEKAKVPGLSIAIMENYKVVWSRGFGLRETGSKDTVNEQLCFRQQATRSNAPFYKWRETWR
jgi:CubicO group peptidase (beta-lactamase class C family)